MDTFETRPPLELAPAGGGEPLAAAALGSPLALAATLAELLDAESRLLARATGEHLPLELELKVHELRAQRARLGLR